MNCGGGKVDINGTEAVITLQAISLHDIVPFRVGRTKMPFKANIIHKRIVSAQPGAMAQSVCLLRPPFSSSGFSIVHIITYIAADHATNWNDERMLENTS